MDLGALKNMNAKHVEYSNFLFIILVESQLLTFFFMTTCIYLSSVVYFIDILVTKVFLCDGNASVCVYIYLYMYIYIYIYIYIYMIYIYIYIYQSVDYMRACCIYEMRCHATMAHDIS